MILATGIGIGSENQWDNLANQDARKSAIMFVLSGGTDPILQTPAEKQRFGLIKEELFLPQNYESFISWEEMKYVNRVRFENPRQLRISKHFKINRCALREYLSSRAVLENPDEIKLDMPFIAVLPQVAGDHNPIDLLLADANYNHAAAAIESHLTALHFDVLVPKQLQVIDDLVHCEKYLKDVGTDNCYILANAIGSDIYIEFTLSLENSAVAGNEVKKVITSVRAYETTTARLLGSETGYSEKAANTDKALIEQSLSGAVSKVLSRIEGYWKIDLERGIQYKVHFAIDRSVPASLRDDIQFSCHDLLKSHSNTVKEMANTSGNFDYLIWVASSQIAGTTDLYRLLQREFQSQFPGLALTKVVLNRKLAIFSIVKS
jgi:hypothetical protein